MALKKSAISILIAAAISLASINAWRAIDYFTVGDFFIYWSGARYSDTFRLPIIYSKDGDRLVANYGSIVLADVDADLSAKYRQNPPANTQTPFMYAVFAKITSSNPENDFIFYTITTYLSLAVFALALLTALNFQLSFSLILLFIIFQLYVPILNDLGVTNINCIQMALVTAAVSLLLIKNKAKYFLFGFFISLIAALKPNIIFIPIGLLLSRAMRGQKRGFALELGGVAAGAATAVSVAWIYFGKLSIWLDWVRWVFHYQETSNAPPEINVSLPALLKHFVGVNISGIAAVLILAFLIYRIIKLSLSARKELSQQDDFFFDMQICALSAIVFLLVSKLVWVHYLTQALPAALMIISPAWISRQSQKATLLGLASLLLISMDFYFLSPALGKALNASGLIAIFLILSQKPYTAAIPAEK